MHCKLYKVIPPLDWSYTSCPESEFGQCVTLNLPAPSSGFWNAAKSSPWDRVSAACIKPSHMHRPTVEQLDHAECRRQMRELQRDRMTCAQLTLHVHLRAILHIAKVLELRLSFFPFTCINAKPALARPSFPPKLNFRGDVLRFWRNGRSQREVDQRTYFMDLRSRHLYCDYVCNPIASQCPR